MTWQGANTANGNGVLAVGGNVAAGTTATFASSQFTNGAALDVGTGAIGDLNVGSGAVLTLNMTGSQQATMVGGNLYGAGTTINLGNFAFMGGQLGDASGTVVNQGNFQWTGGNVMGSGGLTNQGSLAVTGSVFTGSSVCQTIGAWYSGGFTAPGVLTNAGTITHAAGNLLLMYGGSTLNNLAGAVYDIQGDGYGSLGNVISGGGDTPGNTINNAGLFRKSAGSGTAAVVGASFNNTGTVEVDSGTLAFLSGGSSTSAHYEFSNGGRVNASLTWQGANTANGNGVLAVGGNVAAGTTATFASSQFTNGAALDVGTGAIGDLNVGSGAVLTLNMTGSQQATMVGGNLYGAGTTINLGNFAFMGGQLGDASGTVVNQGNFQWTGGNVMGSGGLTNQGSLAVTGSVFTGSSVCQTIGAWYSGGFTAPGVLTNAGTITHAAGNLLLMYGGSTLNNLAGAVYDIQGDGYGSLGNVISGDLPTDTINNAGLFRKSAGMGTAAVVGASFNNTGTVEVDSGTLAFLSGGSSTSAHYEFSNGGRVNASLTWQGANTANGNGVLAVGGNVATGTTATFASSQFTNGAALDVGTGAIGDLNVGSGAVLTLNMTGSQRATMVGGNLYGAGTTINLGNFAFMGGQLGDASGTVVNQGNFQWTGGNVMGTGGLTNQGSLTISGSGAQSIGAWYTGGFTAPGVLTNAGTITHTAGSWFSMWGTSTLNNLAGAVYDIQGDGGNGNAMAIWGDSGLGTINNAGLFRKSAGTGTALVYNVFFNNTGTVEVDSGTLSFGNFTQTAGITDLKGGSLAFSSPAQILGGQLLGSGTIGGSIVNIGGLLSPGHSAGSITINGNYTEGAAGALLIELAGLTSGQFDYLDVNGTASLGGTLDIAFLNGFHPAVGDTFHIMDFNSRTGDFDSIQVLGASGYQFLPEYTSGGLTLLTQAVPEPSTIVMAVVGLVCLLLLARRHRRQR